MIVVILFSVVLGIHFYWTQKRQQQQQEPRETKTTTNSNDDNDGENSGAVDEIDVSNMVMA